MWHYIRQVALAAFSAAGLTLLALEGYVLYDLRAFEYEPLLDLFGWNGIAFILFLNLGLTVALYTCLTLLTQGSNGVDPVGILRKLFLTSWAIAALWMLEWTFMERPLTVRLHELFLSEDDKAAAAQDALQSLEASGDLAALLGAQEHADRRRTAIILQRIRLNAPSVYEKYPIGITIAKYAKKYDVSPILLTYWAYVTSFYGEAVSGRMPFFKAVTSETLRDIIQAHLPWWFVESRLRRWLVETDALERLAGATRGHKLRYALHKATYDLSQDPVSANTYTDALVVLNQYPNEFPELGITESETDPLIHTFLALKDALPGTPLHDPYSATPRAEEYYRKYREDLISFARALLYRLSRDFDFSAKLHALSIRYYSEHFAAQLGEAWAQMSDGQRAALIAMSRDVYIPNIGRLSADVYALPELTWGGFLYVASEARRAGAVVHARATIWRPAETARLWAGGGALLKMLSETAQVMTGQSLPDVRPYDTMGDALMVIARLTSGKPLDHKTTERENKMKDRGRTND